MDLELTRERTAIRDAITGPRIILPGSIDASEIEPRTWWGMQLEAQLTFDVWHEALFVSAIRNGRHGAASWHYLGRAWDTLWPLGVMGEGGATTPPAIGQTRWREAVNDRLPDRFEVIRHDTHLHHELERG